VASSSPSPSSSPAPAFDPFAPPSASLEPRLDPSPKLPLARRGDRFWAYMLDLLVLLPGALAGFAIGWSLKTMAQLTGDEALGLEAIFAALLVLPIQIYQWYAVSKRGQTLGKRWLGIRIVCVDGSPAGFVRAVLLRSWVPFGVMLLFSSIGLEPVAKLFNTIDTISIFTGNRRMIHDLIAGTQVVSVTPPAPPGA
jgi:uncharacterized RDD family membrane protein YckC